MKPQQFAKAFHDNLGGKGFDEQINDLLISRPLLRVETVSEIPHGKLLVIFFEMPEYYDYLPISI